MRKASFALLFGLKIFLLLFISCMVIPFFFLDYGVVLSDPLGLSLFILNAVILATLLFLSIYGIVVTLKSLSNPYQHFLASLVVKSSEESLQHRIKRLSQNSSGFSPVLLETDSISDAFAFGLSRNNSYIIVSPSFLKNLDEDESTAVFYHEMFHIKEDIERLSFDVIFDKAVNTPVNFLYLAIVCVAALAFFVGGWGVATPSAFYEFEAVYPIWLDFVYSTVLPFGLVLAALALLRTWQEGEMLSGRYLYIRELLADSYSAIINRKPMKLYSALVKAAKSRMKSLLEYPMFDKIGFAYSSEKNPEMRDDITLDVIFRTSLRTSFHDLLGLKPEKPQTCCPIKYRLSLLKILQQLIYGAVHVIHLETPPRSAFSISRLRVPEIVGNLLREKNVQYQAFYDYIGKQESDFNLVKCADQIGVEPFEVFLMLFAAVNSGVIDVKLKTAL